MLFTRLVPFVARRLGRLCHSRQGCLRDHDKPVTDNPWMHRRPHGVFRRGRSVRGSAETGRRGCCHGADGTGHGMWDGIVAAAGLATQPRS